jgi:hypothetical protein
MLYFRNEKEKTYATDLLTKMANEKVCLLLCCVWCDFLFDFKFYF